MMSLELPGCFAMSEAGHGSDVQTVRTTATYDATAGEFVLDTPTTRPQGLHRQRRARRPDGCRLRPADRGRRVPRRARAARADPRPVRIAMPGVWIEDDGVKLGLNGVDNGRLGFDRVRVPRENLLDRWGRVTADGVYSSPIENPTGGSSRWSGRWSRGGSASRAPRSADPSARSRSRCRYGRAGASSPEPGHEAPILDYRVHQRRLLPRLAKSLRAALRPDDCATASTT